ncbi:MAG: cation-translocating P-type ATPase, partial [Dethiobacteria bacterium]
LMVVVCREPDGSYGIYVKGAPDAVINYCSSSIGEPGKVLDLKTRNKILAANEKMARKALRVLAFAYKKLLPDTNLDETDLESDLIFCGLAGMSDTPREGVQEAISRCRAAGVKVIMITGDHQRTAEAIAVKLGILGKGKSITGRELEQISDEEFAKQAGKITVYSRTTPDQKLRIVRALKGRGQIVAMTGDGVNDAPAIKEADIGIAMGLSGTDVTRGVADIVLSDDNFVTIVNGIEEGRAVSMNLTKSMRYILSGSLSQILMVFATATLGLPAPLLPAQILWVNLVTESLPAMSFLADPPEQDYMNQPPLKPEGRFLPDQGRAILQKGVLYGLSTFVLYTVGLKLGDWPVEKARTMAFSQLVLNRVFSLITERKTGNTRSSRNRGNPLIFPAAMISTFLLAVTMYLPLMRPLFSTIPLGPKDWAILAANALVTERIDSLIRGKSRETPGEGSVAPRPETGSMVLEPLHGK